MSNTQSFKISNPRIIHETIGENTLVINLDVGHYYSISSTGSAIWETLIAGTSVDRISEIFSHTYLVESAQFAKDLEQFASNLREEGILVENQSSEVAPDISEQMKLVTEAQKYEPPHFIRYTDMEALLLADPIHEFINES